MGIFDIFFGPPSEEKFAKLAIAALRRAGDDRTPTYEKVEFRLVFTKDGERAGVLNLRNLHNEYCLLPRAERDAWLRTTCRGLLNQMEIPSDFEDVRPDLMPTVRARSMIDVMRLDALLEGGKSAEIPALDISEHLVLCLVYDLPTTMQFVTGEHLEKWGVTLYEAAEVARQNLEERSFMMVSVGEKLFILESGDAYDGSRLLLVDRLRQLELSGPPVALAITRDCLLVTGADDDEGLEMMLVLAEQKNDDPRPICPVPIRLAGDEWETWLPPDEHPLHVKFRLLELRYLGGEYAEQKRLLEKRHEQTGDDIFVATYSAVERPDKQVLSYSVWSKGVRTWLPKTDFVGLYDHDRQRTGFVAWDQLEKSVGHLMQSLDCYPPRWLVSEFPSDQEFDALRTEDWGK